MSWIIVLLTDSISSDRVNCTCQAGLGLRTKDKEFENELEVEAQLQLTKQHPLKSKKFHSRYGT